MHKLVGFVSLGCAKNRVNTEQMMYLLRQAGYTVSGETVGADVVVLNTCGFVDSAKSEAIDSILELAELKKSGAIGKLVVTGCLPQRHKDDILTELPEIDALVGTGSFDEIASVVDALWDSEIDLSKLRRFGDISAAISESDRILSTSKAWAYLKIAEGCDNRCAYCCIPDIRGSFRSRKMENILTEAEKLVESGVRELILVAQDTTMYGLDIYGERRLTELLRELGSIEKLRWIRLLYLYPDEINDELIDEISKNVKIVKYLDIPIQHISDNILRKMNRRGTGDEIRSLLKKLRERIDGVVLRTSVITGLPGEGDKEFNELYEFLKAAHIERTGVFAYSPEEGTPAALMQRPDEQIAEQRAEIIYRLGTDILRNFDKSRIGTTTTVLTEAHYESRSVRARSFAEAPDVDGYITVKGDNVKADLFMDIRITGIENGELVGEKV
ncbi:MAG: 30S ribosomal protein S12 methylthiotransferase RimO [Oscillospiraceae bacterium]|nr:30S ribosomal protein S12 methylthiotransferase RimO [Oscillospiraceae bacterium]MCL2278574.1 30S ribosomal protein S12 methylthiotransferase RimO [Oscillospiraceae bacterium]